MDGGDFLFPTQLLSSTSSSSSLHEASNPHQRTRWLSVVCDNIDAFKSESLLSGFCRVTTRLLQQKPGTACQDEEAGEGPAASSTNAASTMCMASPRRQTLSLSVPWPFNDSMSLNATKFMEVISGWTSCAVKSLIMAGGASGILALQSSSLHMRGLMPTSFIALSPPSHAGLMSLISAFLFIGSIKGLGNHATAQKGNTLGMLATALGILSAVASLVHWIVRSCLLENTAASSNKAAL
jgi:hypothetical protein